MAYKIKSYFLIFVLYFYAHLTSGAKPLIESALFTCGYALFKHEEIAMLFPPSDISLANVGITFANVRNLTSAEILHRNALESFCAQVETYSACVRNNLFYFPVDDMVKQFMDLNNVDMYFKFFCRNRKLIADQFLCTTLAVLGQSCPFGGVYGIIAQVSQMIRFPKSRKEFCGNIMQNMICRVNLQLTPCHRKYADVMEWLYRGLVSNYCR